MGMMTIDNLCRWQSLTAAVTKQGYVCEAFLYDSTIDSISVKLLTLLLCIWSLHTVVQCCSLFVVSRAEGVDTGH